MKKTVIILIGVVLIAFGIGFLALNHGGIRNISFDTNEENSINKFFGKSMVQENIDEEKTETIDGVKNIEIKTPFVDVNIIAENRDDVRIHYNGSIQSNYIPELKTNIKANTLYISASKGGLNSYHALGLSLLL